MTEKGGYPIMKKKTDTPDADTRDRSRRRLLQLLAVGGVLAGGKTLPETWVKPVIDEVVLPAHAQMTQAEEEMKTDILIDDTSDDAQAVAKEE